jgi:anti-sigma factor RsiW
MLSCKEQEIQFSLHLDGELDSNEKRFVDTHLENCRACRNAYNKERWFRDGLERSAPLYSASDELRNRMTALTDEHSSTPNPALETQSRKDIHPWFKGFNLPVKRCSYAAAFASILVIAAWIGGAQTISTAQSMTFAETAVDVHQRYTLGQLPLELTSASPNQISNWFDGKVPFHLRLPNYQDISGQEKLYWLKGARLIGFENDYAAYIAYQMGEHPISLVVTSSSIAQPAGGEEIVSKGLVTHFKTIAGFKVLTWTHNGLTYALVSDLEERGQQSCLVCHQGESIESMDMLGFLDIADPFIDVPFSVAERR